jgi:amidase
MLKLAEYAAHDALGLAELVARKEVSPKELALTAAKAIEAANPAVGAVVETYPDRIETLDEKGLGKGPFRGVPFLMKDIFGHEKSRKVEMGSRLCKGMLGEADSAYTTLLRAAGVNILGRSAAPEYSMSGTTETVLYGNTSTPWKQGYSAGGSSGGAAAAVSAGMVPIANGSDIGGSIRIPASLCGGVGLKTSRGRVPVGPTVDEGGLGFSVTFVQTKTMRDAAAMLDCLAVPQPGDPFLIPRPAEAWAALARKKAGKLKVGIVLDELMGTPVDKEVAAAVEAAGKSLASMGHAVERAHADMGGIEAASAIMKDVFFFGFDARLDGYAKRAGSRPGPDTLEPVIWALYQYARSITPARFVAALAVANTARRKLGEFYTRHDIWLSPTTSRVAEPWGNYHLSKPGVTMENIAETMFKVPCQFTLPHNIMGTPALSLPLAMHSSGLPIGVQIAARHADEHLLLQLGTALEEAMPWRDRVPALHVSQVQGRAEGKAKSRK